MARKPNYSFEKRQKELAKQKKKAEKQQLKLEKKQMAAAGEDPESMPDGEEAGAAAHADLG